MKWIKYMFLTIMVFGIVLAFMPATAQACSCVKPPSVAEAMEQRSAIFSGKVVHVEKNNNLFQAGRMSVAVTFEVEKVWKGLETAEVVIYTAAHGGACGFDFNENQQYLVYAYKHEGKLVTTICSRTALLDHAQEDVKELNTLQAPVAQKDLKEPTQKVSQNQNHYIVWSLAGGLVFIGFIALRRKQR